MPAETTNPGLPSLADVPVNEAECRRRTGEIMAIQRETLEAVHGVSAKLDKHVAWHRGGENARKTGQRTGGYYLAIAGLAVTLAAILGGAIWALAHGIGG